MPLVVSVADDVVSVANEVVLAPVDDVVVSGVFVGAEVGLLEGETEGSLVGDDDGDDEGSLLGLFEGDRLGTLVGYEMNVNTQERGGIQ